MGRRGPPPKPSAIRALEGSKAPATAAVNEPKYVSSMPARPAGMSGIAKKIWDDLAPQLEAAGVLRSVDTLAFQNLCEDEATLRMLQAGLKKALIKLAKDKGAEILGNPIFHFSMTTGGRRALGSIRELANACTIHRREFGLTPASNTRVESTGVPGMPAMDSIDMALGGDESDFFVPDTLQ